MMLVSIVRSWTLSLETEIWVWIQEYQPVFTQRNRTSRRYRLRKLLQGIVLHDCGGWVGKSKNCRQAHWEGRLALSGMSRCCRSQGEFLLPQGPFSFALQALQLIESDLPRLSKIFAPASVIMDFPDLCTFLGPPTLVFGWITGGRAEAN